MIIFSAIVVVDVYVVMYTMSKLGGPSLLLGTFPRAAKLSMLNFLSLDQPGWLGSSSHGGATERSQFLKWRHLLLYGYYQSRFGLIPRSRGGRWGLIKATVCSNILQMFVRY